ncbi:MAG: hypothetical protein NTX07_08155 [Solirubrobacterales bacterium]|nr:hypothetical protein [Solirubrobacterales bacterium]
MPVISISVAQPLGVEADDERLDPQLLSEVFDQAPFADEGMRERIHFDLLERMFSLGQLIG